MSATVTLNDRCACGAVLSVEGPALNVSCRHSEWLEAHATCRPARPLPQENNT